MRIRNLLMVAVLVAVAGVPAVADDKDSVMVKPSWNNLRDGAPPALGSGSDPDLSASGVSGSEARRMAKELHDPAEIERRAARSKEEIMNERTDEQVEWMAKHNKEIYGTEDGPFTELQKQEQKAIEARKKVAVYGMTFAEREAMLKAEAEAAKKNGTKKAAEPATSSKPSPGYIYNRKKDTDQPPRLFNNVTP